jgi:anti-sigma-K factor RskA
MDYSRPELADRLAAEYVLGTLPRAARRRFEALLPAHPALREAVARWQQRLAPLDAHAATKPIATGRVSRTSPAAAQTPPMPSAAVWTGVHKRLFGSDTAVTSAAGSATSGQTTPLAWWQRLGLWQGLSGAALAAVVAMAVWVQQPAEPGAGSQPPIVVLLSPNLPAGSNANLSTSGAQFVVSLNADGRSLVLKPVNAPALEATKALELWAVPAQGAPRSLGLVSASAGTTVLRAGLLSGTAAFAVSVEPAGGSPTGAPTGPIVSLGKLGT